MKSAVGRVPPPKRSILPAAMLSETSMATLFVASAFSVLSVLALPLLFDLAGWRRKT
jgi:hypothetical protein